MLELCLVYTVPLYYPLSLCCMLCHLSLLYKSMNCSVVHVCSQICCMIVEFKYSITHTITVYVWLHIHVPYPRERGPTTECRPTPHFWLNFLLRSIKCLLEYAPMCSCKGKRSSNGGFMRTDFHIIEVRSISNLPNSRRTMPSSPCAAFEHKRTIVHG